MKIEQINQKFGSLAEKLIKHRILVLLLFAVIVVLSVIGIKKMVVQTSFDDYFIEGDPMLVMTDEFKAHFGNDYYVGILTETEDHITKESLETMRALTDELKDSLSYVDKVTSLTDIEFMVGNEEGMEIQQIVPEVIPSDQAGLDEIKAKIATKPEQARKLISKDRKLSWIMVKLRTFPEDSVWKKTTTVAPDVQTGAEVAKIIEKPEYASLNPRATGMSYVSYMKLGYIGEEMARQCLCALIISILVMLIMTRSFKGVIAPFIGTVLGLLITFGVAGGTGMYMDSTCTMIPVILAFAVSIAYNIHLFTYFGKRMLIHGQRRKAIIETIAETGWPILFCGLTTIVSLLSFLVIPIRPIAAIGLLTAMCVFFVMTTTIIITPILISVGKNKKPRENFNDDSDTWGSRLMVRLGEFSMRKSTVICSFFLIVCIALGIGFKWVEPAFDVEKTMGSKVPYVKDILDVGYSELGSLYTYDMMIEFENEGDAKLPENLMKLEKLEAQAANYKLTKRTTSVLDIIRDLNRTLNGNDQEYYRIPDSEEEIAQMLLLYENAGGSEAEYWVDYDYKRLRLMVEISDFNSAEVERELNAISQASAEIFPDAKVSAVGNIPQYTTMMQYLVRGQLTSFMFSIIIIGLILMIVFQSVKIGLIGLIPNIFPAIFVGGYMGWSGIPLDMMTATLIPMIIGLSVDDTIHFINHTKLEYDRTGKYHLSIRRTFRVVGVAIVTTTIITCAVFAGFITSECNQLINFGLLAVIGIASALIADLFITPALIQLCKVYGPEKEDED